MLILNYPKKQSVAFSNIMFNLYDRAKKETCDEIVFDLSRTESLTPFGIIMLTATISECFRNGKKCSYRRPKKASMQKFFRETGFHKHFGITDEEFNEQNIIQSGNVQLKRVKGVDTLLIDTLTDILDHHLHISSGVRGSLRMSLQEAMTNVIDHSGVNEYYICSQNYPKKKELRLCIADLGMGIRNSLLKSPNYRNINNDHQAICLATEEGVSSREGRAGLGLSHIKKFLTINKGQLCIISGHGKIFWKFDQGKKLKQSMSDNFGGTILKIIINTNKEGFYFLTDEKEYLF